MKRLFKRRSGQIFGVILGLGFGLYNLYILGRVDQIQEITDHAFDPDGEGYIKRTFVTYGDKRRTVEINATNN